MSLIQLQLADVPFDADVANPEGRPLGSREQVAERLRELLPGTQFDDQGRGTFIRGGYQMVFKLHGDPATAVGVAFDHADAFTPLKRVVDKTGWCLLDPLAKGFVDADASRAAGTTVLVGEHGADDARAGVSVSAPISVATPRRSRISLSIVAGVTIAATAVLVAWQWMGDSLPVYVPASITAGQHASAARFERYTDRVRRRATVMKALAPDFRENPIVEQLVDVQMASRAYWNFVDGRFSSPELLSNPNVWSRFHMQPFLPPAFGERDRDGYAFEFSGETCEESDPGWPECRGFVYSARPLKSEGEASITYALFSADDRIHFRKDGRTPTVADPTVDAR